MMHTVSSATSHTPSRECCLNCIESTTHSRRPFETWPKFLQDPSFKCFRCGDHPIHFAVSHRAPDDVISTILQAYPEAAKKKDHSGKFPLSAAIELKFSNEIIFALLEVSPESAQKLTSHGEFPLHQSIENDYSSEVIMALLRAFPYAAKKQDRVGQYPLSACIEKKCSDRLILELLEANADAAMSDLVHMGDLPLHQSIRKGYSEEVIIAILTAFPQAAKELDHTGSTPLSSSIEQKCPDAIILTLLQANPNAAMAQKLDDDLPLHQAIKMNFSEEVVLAILCVHPEACKKKDANGSLPLNTAVEMKCSDKVIFTLLEKYSDAATNETQEGELLLHQALRMGYSEPIILKIFHEFPSAAMIRSKQSEMLPLHFAAASSASPLTVKTLITEYPEALEKLSHGKTPSDLVTVSLPVDSIKMICKPVSYWCVSNKDPELNFETFTAPMAELKYSLSEVRDTLCNVNAKVDAVHYLLHQVDSKVNNLTSPSTLPFEKSERDALFSKTNERVAAHEQGFSFRASNIPCDIYDNIDQLSSSLIPRVSIKEMKAHTSSSRSDALVEDDKENKRRVTAVRKQLEKKISDTAHSTGSYRMLESNTSSGSQAKKFAAKQFCTEG